MTMAGVALRPNGTGSRIAANEEGFSVGPWRIEPSAREAQNGDVVRRLSPRALRALTMLAEAQGATVSRAALLDAVWPDVHVCEESLTQVITELRRALGRKHAGEALIETVPKCGYRLGRAAMTRRPKRAEPSPVHDTDGSASLEAHVLMLEAQRLTYIKGFAAAAEIGSLIAEARAIAPNDASICARFATLTAIEAVHCSVPAARLEQAASAARLAAQRRPDLAAAHAAQGFIAAKLHRVDQARAHFAAAFSLDPRDSETHYLGACAFFGLGEVRIAAALGERAATLAPDDYRPAFIAARCAARLGDMERARAAGVNALRRVEDRLVETPDAPRWHAARSALRTMLGMEGELHLWQQRGAKYFYDVIAPAEAGEVDLAVDALEALVEGGWRHFGWICADPVAERIGSDWRFRRLLSSLEAA